MSLATRCTACGTIFRVVQDQLRVSEGWVRCGRCAEVFDAREQLFDIDLDTPPVWTGDASEAKLTPTQNSESAEEFNRPAVITDGAPPIKVSQPAAAVIAATVVPHARHEPQWVDVAGGVEEDWSMPRAIAPGFETTDASTADINQPPSMVMSEMPKASIAATRPTSADLPSFMRPADGTARWHRSGARLTMVGLTLLLLALALQLLFHFRDAIAAVYPQSLSSLQALCQTSGCKVQPWRRIEALSVENSALTQADSGSSGGSAATNRYQLTLGLRNKSNTPVATPSIELSLLNSSGAVVMRRVLLPTDLHQDRSRETPPVAIAPGTDLLLRLQLTTGAQRISGYSVEIFHP